MKSSKSLGACHTSLLPQVCITDYHITIKGHEESAKAYHELEWFFVPSYDEWIRARTRWSWRASGIQFLAL